MNTKISKTYNFQVNGLHCASCVLVIESELKNLNYLTNVKVNLDQQSIEVSGDFGHKGPEEIALDLSQALKPHGYNFSVEKQKKEVNWSHFKLALPIALAFAVLFVALQKMGFVNLVNTSTVSYGTAFTIGLIASLSTCMAVVGGLVLSLSATFAKEDVHPLGKTIKMDKWRPQFMFHGGRIFSFFVLGGVLGAVGSFFTLNTSSTFILNLIIGLIMLLLGLNLLDIFHFTKKLQPAMPKFFSRRILGVSKLNHTLTPLLVGLVTFFLPCGFTQSMQIYTLSTGSFLKGGLTMLAYALGTLPVLALLSFSSFNLKESSKSIFFKSAGLIVILFALFNLINSLVVIGLIRPVFNF